MVKVKVGWASLDEKEVVCFNHPMVKVKGVNIIFKDTKDTSFQPPYGES